MEMNGMNSMITMGLDKGMEEGYTCPRCSWGKREHSTRLMSLPTLRNHAQTEHHLQGHALEMFLSEAPRHDRRPSAPQTPVQPPQPYPPPPQINGSVMMGFQQHQQYNAGPAFQHHGASPHVSQAPLHMSQAPPQGPVYQTTGSMNMPQIPAAVLNSIPPGYQLVVHEQQSDQMAPPQQFLVSSQGAGGQGNQNPGQYWGPAQVSGGYPVQMFNSFENIPAPPPGYMTQITTYPVSTQGPGGHNFQPQNQPQGFSQAPSGQQATLQYPANSHLPESSMARVQNAVQSMINFHHSCEIRGKDNEGKNPAIYLNITRAEVILFSKYWVCFDLEERRCLQTRFPYVYEAMLRCGPPPRKAQQSSPAQSAVNNAANVSQMVNVTNTNNHNPPASIQQSPKIPVQNSPLQNSVLPNAPPQNVNADRPMSSGSGIRGAGNPKMNPNYDVQDMLRKKSSSIQNFPNVTNSQVQPAYRSELPTSRELPGVNESISQGPLVSNVQRFSPRTGFINPAQVQMQNTVPRKENANQNINSNAQFNSASQAQQAHPENPAKSRTPTTGSVSKSRSRVDEHTNIQVPEIGRSGGIPNTQSTSQINPATEGLTLNTAEKRKFGTYKENSESALEDATAKKQKVSNSIGSGSVPRPQNVSHQTGESSLSANATSNLLSGHPKAGIISPPDQANSQQPVKNPEEMKKPDHNLTDKQYLKFLQQRHPNCDAFIFRSYQEVCNRYLSQNSNKGTYGTIFRARFNESHQTKLKAYGLCPSFEGTIDLSKMNNHQMEEYKETWITELTSLMLARFQSEVTKRRERAFELERQRALEEELKRREEERITEENRREEDSSLQEAEYERQLEEEKQKAAEERRREDENLKRAESERKTKLLNEMKARVPEARAIYQELVASTVGCDDIFKPGNERDFVKGELMECYEELFDFKSITAEDWEFVHPSNPHPIYRLE